jgi:hypothetical protein
LEATQLTDEQQMVAWNNLVLNADPSKYAVGDKRRAAAIVSIYMGSANNGGLNYFLTYSYDLDAHEVLASLEALGASIAAAQFRTVLDMLGDPLSVSSEDVRWDQLDDLWTDELDEFDVLTEDADQDLVNALTKHVEEFAEFYLQMINGE